MSTLQENLNAIKLDKDTNLRPENLKKDVTCLGVTGTYEGSGGGTVEGIKQFATIEEMNNSTDNKEGDLAVVYRSEVKNATVDSKFQIATFPDTVVLDSAITDYVEVRYRAVDSSKSFDCMGNLDSSMFRMDCYTDSGSIRIEYTSTDGITYTRTDTTGNPVDFGTEIYYEMTEMWNDAIGKFIQVGGSTFDGLYKNEIITRNNHKETVQNPRVEGGIMVYDTKGEFDITPYASNLTKFCQENYMSDFCFICGIKNDIAKLYYIKDETTTPVVVNYNDKLHYGISRNRNTIIESPNHIQIDLTTGNISLVTNSNTPNIIQVAQSSWVEVFDEVEVDTYLTADLFRPSTSDLQGDIDLFYYYKPYDGTSSYRVYCELELVPEQLYLPAPTQLNAISEYVYGKEFYGKNGVEIGTLQNKENLTKDEVKHRVDIWSNYNSGIVCPNDASYMFRECTNLATIPLLDTSSVTTMLQMFFGCKNLTTIPLLDTSSVTSMKNMFSDCTNLTEIPQLDTSSVADMRYMFKSCTNLTTIPLLDTSSVTNMQYMFEGCTSLSDESLNNILAMCTNATSYTGTKTLKYIGLTSAQATKCKSLSNYSAFTSAGWTTGY